MARQHVSQIWLTDEPSDGLPSPLQAAMRSVRSTFPEHEHTLYDQRTLRAFLERHFPADVGAAYDRLTPYAYRADLGRYCLLHRLGGWYVDISVSMQTCPSLGDKVKLLAFRDIQLYSRSGWAMSTSLLFAKPGQPVFEAAIRRIVEHCRAEYYGLTPLCPTGPTVLGGALAAHGVDEQHVLGDYTILTPWHERKNHAFVMPDGTIVGWGKRAEGGDLSALGARGVNNYNDLWYTRRVYLR